MRMCLFLLSGLVVSILGAVETGLNVDTAQPKALLPYQTWDQGAVYDYRVNVKAGGMRAVVTAEDACVIQLSSGANGTVWAVFSSSAVNTNTGSFLVPVGPVLGPLGDGYYQVYLYNTNAPTRKYGLGGGMFRLEETTGYGAPTAGFYTVPLNTDIVEMTGSNKFARLSDVVVGVVSVNGKTGEVVLAASDVGASTPAQLNDTSNAVFVAATNAASVIVANAISNIPQGPVVALLSTDGTEFITLEPGGALTGWQVVLTPVSNWVMRVSWDMPPPNPEILDLLPFPCDMEAGQLMAEKGIQVAILPVADAFTLYVTSEALNASGSWNPLVGGMAFDGSAEIYITREQTGVSYPAFTNAVRTYASLDDLINLMTRAEFIAASNELAEASADAYAAAADAYELAGIANGVALEAVNAASAASQNAYNAYELAETVQLDLLPLKADASNGVFTGTMTLNGDTIASWPTGGSTPTTINVTTASVISVSSGTYYINIADWAATGSTFAATAELDMTPEFTVTGRYEFAFSDLGGGRVRGKQTWPSIYAWLEQPRATANGNADMGYALSSIAALTDAQITNSVYISAACDCPALVRVSYVVNNAASRTNAVAIYAGVWVAGVGEAYTTNVLATIYPTGTALNTQTAVFVLPSRTQLASTVGLGQYAGFDWVRYGLRHARAGATAGYIYVQCVRARPLGANERLAYDTGWRP